ncbi:MAG: hypothetical protein EHM86_03425, partial [Desulfobulbaceae bacterium]
MKSLKNMFFYSSLLLLLMLSACSSMQQSKDKAPDKQDLGALQTENPLDPTATKATAPPTLPVQYQTPSYLVGQESKDELSKS